MQKWSVVLFFVLSSTNMIAQLPPFRYVGVPEQYYPIGTTVLLSDRIVINNGGHYVYRISNGTWSPLPNLDTANVFSNQPMALNDSLIGFFDERVRLLVWNVDTDQLMATLSDVGSVMFAVDPNVGCIVPREAATIETTAFITGERQSRTVSLPSTCFQIKSIAYCPKGGYWVLTYCTNGHSLFWTASFDTFELITEFSADQSLNEVVDGDRLCIWNTTRKDSTVIFSYVSRVDPPVQTIIKRQRSSPWTSTLDAQHRVWTIAGGIDDGLYRASSQEPTEQRITRFEHRTRPLTTLHIERDGAMVSVTTAGIFITRDEGMSWTQIDLPKKTSMLLPPSSRIQPIDDGSLFIAGDALYHFDPQSERFEPAPIDQGGNISYWYRRGNHWLGLGSNGGLCLSDDRGLFQDTTRNISNYASFISNDSVIVRWLDNYRVKMGAWTPGALSITANEILRERYDSISTVQQLSNGKLWLGGISGSYTYSNDGTIEAAQTVKIPVVGYHLPVIANEIDDSLYVLYDISRIGSLPTYDLSVFVPRAREQLIGNTTILIEGHDGHAVAIQSDPLDPTQSADSLVIMSPDFRTTKVRRFENITESRVYDIAYDPINRVYYALTERGLYRSDPVVTSVASDDQRPAYDVLDPSAEIPLQTSWYTTLGQRIEPPTNSGVYLKIEFDDKGQMVTEKVLIP